MTTPHDTSEHDPDYFCGGKRHQIEGTCTLRAGWGTSHPGVGKCKLHGGGTVQSDKAAARVMAGMALRRLGRPMVTEPQDALLAMVHEAAGNVACLRDLVGELGESKEPTDDHLIGPDHLGDQREHVLAQMYREWCRDLVRFAAEAVKCGLSERVVRLEEERAALVAKVMLALLDDPELGLSRDQRERGRHVAGRHLRALGAAL